jgi:hypothetical protein
MSRRRAALLASTAALFWLCRRAYYVGFFNDDAFYLIGAKSLLTGRYAELQAPGAPPLVNYLPGWPLMLAPAVAFARGSLAALQAWAVLLHVAALGLLAGVFEREDGAEIADLTLAALAASPLIASTAGTLLSDGPMLFCAAASLAVLPRLRPRRDWPAWLCFGLALGLAALTRPTGLALAAAVALTLASERRFREAALALGTASAALGAWLWRDAALSGAGWNYWREASSSARSAGILLASNAAFAARDLFARALWRPPFAAPAAAGAALALAGTALCALGFRRLRSPEARAAALFAVLFLAPHLLWAKQASRYLIPVLPFALWGVLRGLSSFGRRAALAGAVLAIVLSGLATARVVAASWSPAPPLGVPPARAASFLRGRAVARTVVAAEYDARWNLLTGLPCVHIPYDARTPEALARFLAEGRVGFVVVEDTGFALRPAAGAYTVPTSVDLRGLLERSLAARLEWSDPEERAEVWRVERAGP